MRRETLDEAIDRVASRMTQHGGNADIQPVWLAASTRLGFSWRLAGAVGVSMVVLALIVMWPPRIEESRSNSSITASAASVWSPLTPPVASPGTASRRSALRTEADRRPAEVRLRAAPTTVDSTTAGATNEAEVFDRPTWGIPFIEPPAPLAVAEATLVEIEVETVGVDGIEIAPLTVPALAPDGAGDSKER